MITEKEKEVIGDIIIPCRITMLPYPIRTKKHVRVQLVGLPPGLLYDEKLRIIKGYPTIPGYYGVVALLTQDDLIRYLTFNIRVIECSPVPISLPRVNDQTVPLGQPIRAINLHSNDPTLTIIVSGLPSGVTYDPFTEQITGLPDTPGEYRTTIQSTNLYGDIRLDKFILDIDGIANPALVLQADVVETVSDTTHHFHQAGDTITYTLTLKNTGNVPLIHVGIKESKLGPIESLVPLGAQDQLQFKRVYKLSTTDLETNQISICTTAVGQTSTGIKIATAPVICETPIRGHEKQLFHLKMIRWETIHGKLAGHFIIVNSTGHQVQQLQVTPHIPSVLVTLDQFRLDPWGVAEGHITIPTDTISSKLSRLMVIMNGRKNQQEVGNMCEITLPPQNHGVDFKLYSTEYVVASTADDMDITLIAKFHQIHHSNEKENKDLCGTVKFYDRLTCLGKASIKNGIALLRISHLDPGIHTVYGIYNDEEGCGSDVCQLFIGTVDTEHTQWIQNNVDRVRKLKETAIELLKSHRKHHSKRI